MLPGLAWPLTRHMLRANPVQVFLTKFEGNGCSEDVLREVLGPLQLACASTMAKVVDLALGCLHKLVAHAWLQVRAAGAPGALHLRRQPLCIPALCMGHADAGTRPTPWAVPSAPLAGREQPRRQHGSAGL